MQYNSTVAKLLAKENITIKHGNYNTAWFDVEKRVLGLPMWKDMGKDVYDLLIGHEVGHALETPFEGWHDSEQILKGCPRTYLNVIEDARIERKIQSQYPGLVGSFTRGYKALSEKGFFGDLEAHDWDAMDLIDKINIQAKLRGLVDVKFNGIEKSYYDRALLTDTWDDVVALTLEIVEYTNSREDDKPKEEVEEASYEKGETGDVGEEVEVETNSDTEETGTESTEQEEAPTEEEDEKDADSSIASGSGHVEDMQSVTDSVFRQAEEELISLDNDGQQTTICQDISKANRDIAVISYDKVKAGRAEQYDYYKNTGHNIPDLTEGYSTWMKETKKSVYFAVKEFEMRKAAFQYSRATTADSGRIDVSKLWSYKINDDIFSQVTNLADAKNHGMIMLVDYSGSMFRTMPYVVNQLIHLIMFCKQTNIPFDVYGVTTGKSMGYQYGDGDMEMDDICMPLLSSSSLNKADYNDSLRALFVYREAIMNHVDYNMYTSEYEKFGSTPLDQALVISHHLIKRFQAKHRVQKMNLVVLSDGEANYNHVYRDRTLSDKHVPTQSRYSSGVQLIVDKKIVRTNERTATIPLLKNLKARYGVNTIGFFIADDARDFKACAYKIIKHGYKGSAESNLNWTDKVQKLKSSMTKEYARNKCVSFSDSMGYDEYYIIKGGKELSTDVEAFDADGDFTKSALAKAFKKYSHSKKQSKVLMTKFGKAVA